MKYFIAVLLGSAFLKYHSAVVDDLNPLQQEQVSNLSGLNSKDGRLYFLADLMNQQQELFVHWNHSKGSRKRIEQSYLDLVDAITPWVIGEPTAPLTHTELERGEFTYM